MKFNCPEEFIEHVAKALNIDANRISNCGYTVDVKNGKYKWYAETNDRVEHFWEDVYIATF